YCLYSKTRCDSPQGFSFEYYNLSFDPQPLRRSLKSPCSTPAVPWKFTPRIMKLREIASALGCRIEGDGELEITGIAGIEHAGPSHLTFLANPKYAPMVRATRAGAILVSAPIPGLTCLVSDNPYLDFARALALF